MQNYKRTKTHHFERLAYLQKFANPKFANSNPSLKRRQMYLFQAKKSGLLLQKICSKNVITLYRTQKIVPFMFEIFPKYHIRIYSLWKLFAILYYSFHLINTYRCIYCRAKSFIVYFNTLICLLL